MQLTSLSSLSAMTSKGLNKREIPVSSVFVIDFTVIQNTSAFEHQNSKITSKNDERKPEKKFPFSDPSDSLF